jgi:hypothetical protein
VRAAAVAGAVLWLPRGARVLRDLLRRRHRRLRSLGPPLEAALTDCALHAARAVGLDLPAHERFGR